MVTAINILMIIYSITSMLIIGEFCITCVDLSGVCSASFITTVFPVAKAGPSFQAWDDGGDNIDDDDNNVDDDDDDYNNDVDDDFDDDDN